MPISPKSAKAIADTVDKATKKAVKKASEALGEHEGKYLNITQSDRMRVGGKDLGGPGFPTLSLERPEYEGAVWGVGNPSVASTIIGANKRYPEGQAIWTTMIGSPEQHRSNQHVFDELHKQFKKSAKAGNLDPVLHDAINQRLRMAIDADGLPMFPEDIDILSKDFKKHADRFDKRAVAADVMGGVGIGGKKGQIFDYGKVMSDLTDPMVKDVPAGSLGYRLFQLSGEKSERPDLHSAFPHILHGEDLGVSYTPAPREIIMQKWIDDFVQRTGRKPGFLDWTRGYAPSTQITEEMLTNLQREGFAKGGKVDLEAEFRKDDMIAPKGYKEGGDLEKDFKKADMIDMSGFRQDPLEKATRRADNRPKKQSSMSELNKRLNIAKEVGAELTDEFKKSSAKEARAIAKSPKGVGDLLKNIAGDYAAMIEGSPIIPTLTGSSQNELAKLALTAMKGKKALEKEYANRKPSDLMGKELSAYGMENMEDGMLRKAIMGDAESMPIASTVLGLASPFAGRALAKGAKAIAPDVMRAIEKATVDPYKFNIVKPEGGQFIDSTLKENLKQLKQGGEDNQINKALDSWIDSTLRKYVVNRMGTESDEVRKLFDKGITHVAPEQLRGAPNAITLEQHRARLPASGKRAETEVGQAWEDASDYSLYGRRRGSYDEKDVENYPWLSKMAPEDMVYGASIDSSALKDRLGFGHVIDVIRGDLRSGKLRPEQLNKVSVEDAIKRTHSFNQEMAKKAEETAITVQSGMPVHREYPEGYKWVELKHPDAKKTEEMLTYEGDTMGHCVGSYCEDVMDGQTRIFSLRDDKGKPHVTIEVQPETGVLYSQMADLLGEKEVDRMLESGMSPRQIVDANPELQELRTYKISQIKGKGNEKPSAKYIPFVQDFVKNPVAGKEWADVGDFRNTDLIDARKLKEHGVMPDADKETMNAALQELDRIYPMNRLPGGQAEFSGAYGDLLPSDAMLKAQLQDLTSPYLTKEDIINHLRSKEALPVEQSYSKYYENLPKDEGIAHGGDVHMAKGGFMGAVETAGELGREGLRRFTDKLNKLSRNVAYNTYEQVPYVGAKHLEGMAERPFGEKLFFTEEAPWGSPEKDADLLAKYLGLESGQSQKGVGLYQPPIEGAPLEFNPQISSRTLVKSDKGRYNENLIAEPDKASMSALGATRGYLDVQGASPWVRPSQGSGRLYNGFHISLNGKPTEKEMRKIGEIQARYGFWGAGDLGKSGVYVGFNPEMTRDDLNKMQRAFRKDIKEALGDRVAGVKMMKSEGDYPAFEEAWQAPQGTGAVTRQLMEYLDTAKEKNPLLAEYYAQKPSTELQKLMQEMNIRDIKAPEKYGVGAPREDVMKARDIFAEYGIEGLRDALNRGEYLPAAVAIPSGIELFRDDN